MSSKSDNPYDANSEYWTKYMSGRPQIPLSIWQRIFDYHSSHGGNFGVANDVGAGTGQFSRELAKRFQHVIVTEPGHSSLESAKTFLSIEDKTKYTFVQAKAEDQVQPKASVDLVLCSNALHWADVDTALEAFARQVKPGGTLAFGYIGFPLLHDSDATKAWQSIWGHVFDKMYQNGINWDVAVQDSGADAVAVPADKWDHVVRLKLNAFGENPFTLAPGSSCEWTSKIDHTRETIVEEKDEQAETLQGLQYYKNMIDTMPVECDSEMIQQFWDDFEQTGHDGKFRGFAAASLVLAVRKE